MGAIRIKHLALGIALTGFCTGCSSWRPPTVVKVVRTTNNSDTISSKDYERLREVTEALSITSKSWTPTSARD